MLHLDVHPDVHVDVRFIMITVATKLFTSIKKCFLNLFNLHDIKHYIKNVWGIFFLM